MKTISVPPGAAGLIGAVKDRLRQAGWQLFVYQGPDVTKGSVDGADIRLSTKKTFKSRYRLLVSWAPFDVCLNLVEEVGRYDISLIDNASGSEAITMSGRGCTGFVADKFMAQLK